MTYWPCSKREKNILFFFIFVGLCLRLWGIKQDLPYSYYGDESYLIYHALKFGTGDLNPHWFVWPTLFQYTLFFFFGTFYLLGLALGWFKDKIDFLYLYLKDPTTFFLIGRTAVAILGTISIYLVYILAQKAYNKNLGLLCAGLFTFLPLAVEYSHYAVVDTPLVFMILLTTVFILNILLYGGLEGYLLCGFLTGLAIGTKYPALFLVFPIFLAHLFISKKRGFFKIFLNPEIILCFIFIFLGFFLACPFAILDFPKFLFDMKNHVICAKIGWCGWEKTNPYAFHLTQNLKTAMGLPLLLVSIISLAYAMIRRQKTDLILLSFPIVYFLFIGWDKNYYSRFMLPLLPFLAISSGRLLLDLKNWATGKKVNFLFYGFLTLIFINPVYRSIKIDLDLSLPNTMTLAKEWVEKNIPPGTKILLNEGGPSLAQSPLRVRLEAQEKPVSQLRYGYHKQRGIFYKIKEKVAAETKNHELTFLSYPIGYLEGEAGYEQVMEKTMDAIKDYKNRYDYAIISEALIYKLTGYPEESIPRRYRGLRGFYEDILNNCQPIKVFSPQKDISRGPTIKIYKLR